MERQADGSYAFLTDSGISYKVVFYAQDDLFSVYTHLSHLFFDFAIEVADLGGHRFPPKDYRSGDTVIWIVEAFFTHNPDAVLTYICDDLDGKQYKRHLQFSRWFDRFKQKTGNLEKHDHTVDITFGYVDDHGQRFSEQKNHYVSLLLSPMNTQRQLLLAAFGRALDDYREAKN